jgi:dipeptidyl aminopeptidase/acylaminoacyl peptidase
MTIDDLFNVKRVADPQISPDGKMVVYVLTTVDLANNSTSSTLWLADGNSNPRQLTTTTKKDRHPRWSPDGKQILFESNRSGDNQLWVISLDGGEARQLTTIATEAGTGIWSPDGKWIAFVSTVYPEYSTKPYAESNALNKKRKEEAEKNPVKAKVFTKLFYRHWDSYVEDKRQHLFVMPATGGEPKDVTPGDRDAYPTSTTFSIGDDFTFSPDSSHLLFTAVPEKNEAWSTNFDICRVSIMGGTTGWECLTKDNPAADGAPQFSRDGRLLAYRAQKRPGFEADKWDLMIVGVEPNGTFTGKPRSITTGFDTWPEAFVWSDDNETIYTLAEEQGFVNVFALRVSGEAQPKLAFRTKHSSFGSISISKDGTTLAYTLASLNWPPEVHGTRRTARTKTPAGQVQETFRGIVFTNHNGELFAQIEQPAPESITVPGAGGTLMQMWILKPLGFDPSKKWPLVYLVHGGPQGAWLNNWSYRWNPQLWAAQGYVVTLPNPRGSTGFGQKYIDEISGDWGGKCFEDLMKGVEYLEKQPYIDTDRMAAAGASFGGYMMNWFAGHPTKFKTLINHCGVFNHESMYATTEELWFDEWDHGEGKPLWENREKYRKHSPHLLAKNFKTPMLIIHNDLDFRVPVGEGHQLFTTLQRLGVPSKFINFPDEGHWVLKPANSKYWHEEVFAWLKKYAPPGGR